jgi:hypothetical protein
MKLLALNQLIPLVLMGAAAPGCVEQRPANETSVAAASRTPVDLSFYRPEELGIYQARCEQELKTAIERGDNAGAQSWARLRDAVIAEKERQLQAVATPAPSPTPHKTAPKRRRHHRPVPKSALHPTQESTPRPTPEEYPLPPGWPVGPKE